MSTGSGSSGGPADAGMIREAPARSATDATGRGRIIPSELQARYRIEATRLLFPDRTVAIEDRDDRLVARTGNPQVAEDLVAIAHARGWGQITSHGTPQFRARIEQAARERAIEIVNAPAAPASAKSMNDARRARAPEPGVPSPPGLDRANTQRPERRPGDATIGTFVQAGEAPYRFQPENSRSFYLRLTTSTGTRELWGSQLRQALAQSGVRPQPGEPIAVQYVGSEPVRRSGVNEDNRTSGRRNLWRIDSLADFEARRAQARAVRESRDAASIAQDEPALAQAALVLRAAELFARRRIGLQGDRDRFIDAVRASLATNLERGAQLPAIRLRERDRSEPKGRDTRARQQEDLAR